MLRSVVEEDRNHPLIYTMEKHVRIEINPEIMFGKPVIKGTRITVEHILHKLGGGMSIEEILEDHPHLKPDDIFAAQEFAADYLGQEEIMFTQKYNG
ncbi:MAG: DUF433 domain-containing protein [Balneolales bacterium]